MSEIEKILSDTRHRPYSLPENNWLYYQEWNNALFLHWKAPYTVLRALVPQKLILDSFNGGYYISFVAFTMQKIRPRYLPAVKLISDFHEINIRTYIENDHKKGVYFLSIEAQKILSVFIARILSGLPYVKSDMERNQKSFKSINKNGNKLMVEYEIQSSLTNKTELDTWLTERYSLYLDIDSELFRYDIHHSEWSLKSVKIESLNLNYTIGELEISNSPDYIHYSTGVKVVSWQKIKI